MNCYILALNGNTTRSFILCRINRELYKSRVKMREGHIENMCMRDEEDIASAITLGVTPTSVISFGHVTQAHARQINGLVLWFLHMRDMDKSMILHS